MSAYRRPVLPEGTSMTAAQAAGERVSEDAAAVAGSCPYEADELDDEVWRDLGFYPPAGAMPPF